MGTQFFSVVGSFLTRYSLVQIPSRNRPDTDQIPIKTAGKQEGKKWKVNSTYDIYMKYEVSACWLEVHTLS